MNQFKLMERLSKDLPTTYGITIEYIDRKSKTFDVIGHQPVQNGVFECRDTAGLVHLTPISNVFDITFDHRFSKLLDEAEEKLKKQIEENSTAE